MKLGFSRQIFKNTQISSCMKILIVGAELFHAHRRTDRHGEANGRPSQYCGSAKKEILKAEIFIQKSLNF